MINLSVRQKRLLKMWAQNFAIALVGAIATFTIVTGGLIGLLMLGKAYGPPAVLGTFVVCFMLTGCAILTYAHAKEKLEKIEREEERTMNALKTDFSKPEHSQSYKDLMNQLDSISAKIKRKPFK